VTIAAMRRRGASRRARHTDLFAWFRDDLLPKAAALSDRFRDAWPYPHIVLDDFLPSDVAEECLARFPDPTTPSFQQPDSGTHQVRKQGRTQDGYFAGVDPWLRHVLHEFNGMPFLDFLQRLTGIGGLIPDPHFHGGAFHQILPGGKLDMHADFNVDAKRLLLRRINVHYYLNKAWCGRWGGDLLLRHARGPGTARIAPTFNRLVIVHTDSESYHGHPEPLDVPAGVTRKSLALYYYTSDPVAFDSGASHSTLWQPN